MARGAIWMLLFRFTERGLGLISTLILARLLSPEDFGVVAMAMSFITMAELLSSFSFDAALIHNRQATREHFDSAWTCNLLIGFGISGLLLLLAQPVADFYQRPELVWVVLALAIGPAITGAQNIGVVAFLRELDFRKEFRFQVSRKLVGFCVVIPLAFIYQSYWVLVVGMLVSRLAGFVISFLMHPYRPRWCLSKARELVNFSRWLLINNFAGFLKERAADFFIGRASGATALGTYTIAYELANLPTTEIGAPINRAFLPGFASMDSQDEIARAFRNAIGFLALIVLPTAACMYVTTPFLVAVLLGNKWLAAAPLMQLLVFNGVLVVVFQSLPCAVMIGRGFPARVMAATLTYTLLLLAALASAYFFMPDFGVTHAAYAALATSVATTPLYLYQVRKTLKIGPSLFASALIRPVLASAAVVLVVPGLLPAHEASMGSLGSLVWLVAGCALGVAIYTAMILLTWWVAGRPDGPERKILAKGGDMLTQQVTRLRRARAADLPR